MNNFQRKSFFLAKMNLRQKYFFNRTWLFIFVSYIWKNIRIKLCFVIIRGSKEQILWIYNHGSRFHGYIYNTFLTKSLRSLATESVSTPPWIFGELSKQIYCLLNCSMPHAFFNFKQAFIFCFHWCFKQCNVCWKKLWFARCQRSCESNKKNWTRLVQPFRHILDRTQIFWMFGVYLISIWVISSKNK